MRLDWNETVAGVPMLVVRDCLKKTRRGIGRSYFAELLGKEYDSSALLEELLNRGWLEEEEGGSVQNTVEGNAVAQAKKVKPITRASAEELLARVVETVDHINASPLYAYRVSKLAVFGSFLSDSPDLGDLDVAYELEARFTSETAEQVREQSIASFPPPPSANWLRLLGWPEEVVITKMAVSNRVSLERLSTIELYGWPHQLLRG